MGSFLCGENTLGAEEDHPCDRTHTCEQMHTIVRGAQNPRKRLCKAAENGPHGLNTVCEDDCVGNADRLSGLDSSFLHMERDGAHMHVASTIIFEGPAPAARSAARGNRD